MLYPDNAEEMVFETEDIIKHNGMFSVTRRALCFLLISIEIWNKARQISNEI